MQLSTHKCPRLVRAVCRKAVNILYSLGSFGPLLEKTTGATLDLKVAQEILNLLSDFIYDYSSSGLGDQLAQHSTKGLGFILKNYSSKRVLISRGVYCYQVK